MFHHVVVQQPWNTSKMWAFEGAFLTLNGQRAGYKEKQKWKGLTLELPLGEEVWLRWIDPDKTGVRWEVPSWWWWIDLDASHPEFFSNRITQKRTQRNKRLKKCIFVDPTISHSTILLLLHVFFLILISNFYKFF